MGLCLTLIMLSRRSFLRARFRAGADGQRPPWALAEEAFQSACTRCDECVTACPTKIVVPGGGGYPVVDFSRGECTFCGECAAVCRPRALSRDVEATPWTIVAAIGEGCLPKQGVDCRLCGEACAMGAIRFRPQLGAAAQPELDAACCTGCGACYQPCPVGAIEMKNAVESIV